MKIKLLLIVMALLASYPAAFAEGDDIAFFDDPAEIEMIGDIAFEDSDTAEPDEIDPFLLEETAQLNGEAVPWNGTSTAEPEMVGDVYEIRNGAQLAWIAEQVNMQTDSLGKFGGMLDVKIRLVEDIDLNGQPWTPIGLRYDRPFAGEFDGDGHTVSGLTFDAKQDLCTNAGLFGCVLGTVRNLTVKTVDEGIETGRNFTPTGVSFFDGHTNEEGEQFHKAAKCGIGIVAGSVDGRKWEYNNKEYSGLIENCTAEGSLTVRNENAGEEFFVGGIAGVVSAGVNDCGVLLNNKNKAAVSVESPNRITAERAFAGGIAGFNFGEIVNDEDFVYDEAPSASVSAASANPFAGAVVGGNSGLILNTAYNGEKLTISRHKSDYSLPAAIGGIAGVNGGTIEHSRFEGELKNEITGDNTYLAVGGIAGEMADPFRIVPEDPEDPKVDAGIIDYCDADGTISAEADAQIMAGLIVGYAADSVDSITDCSARGTVKTPNASKQVSIGGIAGESRSVIDSCESDAALSADGSAPVNAGGIAGAAYNTVTDCLSGAKISIDCTSAGSDAYAGGIAGRAYGSVTRSSFSGEIRNSAVEGYAGGIAGFASTAGNSILPAGVDTLQISKCVFGSGAALNCTYISGGIVGDARGAKIMQCSSEGTISGADEESVGAGGIVGTAISNLAAENCKVSARLSTKAVAGVAFAVTGDMNKISTSYIAPSLQSDTIYPIAHAQSAGMITTYGVYINKDAGIPGEDQEGITYISADAAKDKATFTKNETEKLNFDTIWLMGETEPELQFESYSNTHAVMTEAKETRLYFRVTMENPGKGGKSFIALYNRDGRFCGTASAQPEETDMNRTGTKAEMMLEYEYYYWDNPLNYDEHGYFKDPNEWEYLPSEAVPAKMKAFTWDDTKGMKDLSSVEEQSLYIYFE